MIEIDRRAVTAILLDRVRDMIETEFPGTTTNANGQKLLDEIVRSPGFQSLVTQQVAEFEARMKGQVH
ncbi:hypothetical protein [Hydrogenophaga sp.]|uniref:hypothetical protein n=1 Tax=Hydrogenophaga sp. TaxID=1904254 RepID=UPI003F725341